MPAVVVAWLAVGVIGGLATFVMIGLLACVIVRERRHAHLMVTSSASLTTDLDDEKAAPCGEDYSDAESCSSPAQDITVSQSTPDLIGRDAGGYLATGHPPDVID